MESSEQITYSAILNQLGYSPNQRREIIEKSGNNTLPKLREELNVDNILGVEGIVQKLHEESFTEVQKTQIKDYFDKLIQTTPYLQEPSNKEICISILATFGIAIGGGIAIGAGVGYAISGTVVGAYSGATVGLMVGFVSIID